MKQIVFLCFLALAAISYAQPKFGVEKKDSCYKKATERSKQRFAEWECGKIAGVVDCNEKLELDPGSNTVITAAGKKPFSGTCETCHMNGLLERRVKFVNGKTDGVDSTNYASGCLMVVRSHIQGVENGKWMYFNDSTGIMAWEKNYSMGQFHGPQVTYTRKGDTLKFENYNMGVLQGKKVTYDAKGIRIKQVSYKNGELDGPFLVYNKDGKIIEEINYKEGKKHGVFKYYYDDGTLLRTENWDMDCRNGEFKTLFYDGKVQSIEIYKKSAGNVTNYYTTETYECKDEATAKEVKKLLDGGKKKAQVLEAIGSKSTVNVFEDKRILPDQKSYFKGAKLEGGVNKPYKLDGKYYVVLVLKIDAIAKNEIREGWFEDRFPDGKIKRRALYSKDVLIEEHVFDEQGREIKTFGGNANSGKEDDAMPTETGKKSKKGKK